MENIAIIITKLYGGGAERVASNLSIELSEFYNVKLIVFDGSKILYPYEGELIDLNIPPSNSKLGKITNVFKRINKLKKIKKEYNIKCSISLLDGPNMVNVFSKRNDKIITSVRIFLSNSENTNKIRKLIIKLVSKKSDKVVSLSKTVEEDLIRNFDIDENKVLTIYNSCDGTRLLEQCKNNNSLMMKEFPIGEGKKYISTMGRLTKQKGQWHLIRAFRKVVDRFPNIHLVILGEGELKSDLNKLIKNLNLEKNVHLLGYIKDPHKIIYNSEFFVFPSLYEGLGNVLLEALACGKAVISTDCDAGPREILSPNTNINEDKVDSMKVCEYGILVPVCNGGNLNHIDELTFEEVILAESIEYLLENPVLKNKLSEKSINRANDFAPRNISNQWIELVEECTK